MNDYKDFSNHKKMDALFSNKLIKTYWLKNYFTNQLKKVKWYNTHKINMLYYFIGKFKDL